MPIVFPSPTLPLWRDCVGVEIGSSVWPDFGPSGPSPLTLASEHIVFGNHHNATLGDVETLPVAF